MMAIIAEGKKGRIYFSPTIEHESIAKQAKPDWRPETDLPEKALGFRVQLYGMTHHSALIYIASTSWLNYIERFCKRR